MQRTTVYSSVRVLAETIAGIPIHLYRRGEDGSKQKATDHPTCFILWDELNPDMTSFTSGRC